MYNQVSLIGNLGGNPELRATQTGKAVCNFQMATQDQYSKEPEWHRIVVWGKTAEACAKFLEKGRKVHVEGKIQYRKYEDRNGVTRTATEIVASKVNFLSGNTSKQSAEEVPTAELEDLNEDAPF